jgi:hypothetical protein
MMMTVIVEIYVEQYRALHDIYKKSLEKCKGWLCPANKGKMCWADHIAEYHPY